MPISVSGFLKVSKLGKRQILFKGGFYVQKNKILFAKIFPHKEKVTI